MEVSQRRLIRIPRVHAGEKPHAVVMLLEAVIYIQVII